MMKHLLLMSVAAVGLAACDTEPTCEREVMYTKEGTMILGEPCPVPPPRPRPTFDNWPDNDHNDDPAPPRPKPRPDPDPDPQPTPDPDPDPQPPTGTNIPFGISHVIYQLADGTTVKVDEYGGDVKDPTDPQQYSDPIGAHFNQDVSGYTIKAGQNHYDASGAQVPDIPNQADFETTQDGVGQGVYN